MIFFDSYAILEIMNGNPNYGRYKDFVIITNTLNLSEVFYSLLRETNLEIANKIISKIDFEFIEISEDIAIDASIFKFKNKKANLSYADCIGYITSVKNNLKFLTGDKEFKNFDNVEFVK